MADSQRFFPVDKISQLTSCLHGLEDATPFYF